MDDDENFIIEHSVQNGNRDYPTKRRRYIHKRDDYSVFHHFLLPSIIQYSNVESFLTNEDLRRYSSFPYSSSLPVPFGKPALLDEQTLRGTDPPLNLVSEKSQWEAIKDKIISASTKTKRAQVVKTNNNLIRKAFPGTVALAKHLATDPDPNFSGTYNWYYTGGCSTTILGTECCALVNTHNSTPGFLIITPLKITESDILPSSSFTVEVSRNIPVLQVVTTDDFIGVRQKKSAYLYRIKKDNTIKIDCVHSNTENRDYIVSISVNPRSSGHYCYLTSSNNLKIWSIKSKCCKNIIKLERSVQDDKWGFVKYLSKSLLLTCDRYMIYVRNKFGVLISSDQKFNIKPHITSCDYITNVIPSVLFSNKVFVSTKHSALELDFSSSFQRKWTHMMEFPPLFGCTSIINDDEILFLANQSADEVCVIGTQLQVMPYLLSTPNETLNKARVKGMCLDPEVSSRFGLSLVGIATIAVENTVYIFRCTSIGDVFFQSFVQKTEEQRESINFDLLMKWECDCKKSFQNLPYPSLEVTDVVNFTDLFNRIRETRLMPIKRKKTGKTHTWMLKKDKIQNCTDPLAECLLDAWELDEEDGKIHIENPDKGISNVESWLGNLGKPAVKSTDDNTYFMDRSGNAEQTQEGTSEYDVKSWLGEVTGYFIDKTGNAEIYVDSSEKVKKPVEEQEDLNDSIVSGFYISRTGSSEATEVEERTKVNFSNLVEVVEYEPDTILYKTEKREENPSVSGINENSTSHWYQNISTFQEHSIFDTLSNEEQIDIIPLTPTTPVKKSTTSRFTSGF